MSGRRPHQRLHFLVDTRADRSAAFELTARPISLTQNGSGYIPDPDVTNWLTAPRMSRPTFILIRKGYEGEDPRLRKTNGRLDDVAVRDDGEGGCASLHEP